MRRRLKKLLTKAKLPPEIRIHDGRHSYSTTRLQKHHSIEVVSKGLGHHDSRITSEVYSHILPSSKDTTLDELDAIGQHFLTPQAHPPKKSKKQTRKKPAK